MAVSDRKLLDALSRMPFVDSTELALILGEPHATVHRHLTGLLDDGVVACVIHGTVHLPASGRYFLTARGVRGATAVLGFDTLSDFVWAYPMSREWLTLLIRRMEAVYRLEVATTCHAIRHPAPQRRTIRFRRSTVTEPPSSTTTSTANPA